MRAPRELAFVQVAVGAPLLALLVLPPVRLALESSMSMHMLVQYPTLMLSGALLGKALPHEAAQRLKVWNEFGVSGLTACVLFFAVLMIPRVLDLALVDARVECAKFAALLFAGAVLRPSLHAAGLVIQGFFLGSVVPMTIAVGSLFRDAPLRLCNAYRLDDQQQLGLALICVAGVTTVVWFLQVVRRLSSSAA
jgi:hypothetical protein